MLALREVRLRLFEDRSERTGILHVSTHPSTKSNPAPKHNTKPTRQHTLPIPVREETHRFLSNSALTARALPRQRSLRTVQLSSFVRMRRYSDLT